MDASDMDVGDMDVGDMKVMVIGAGHAGVAFADAIWRHDFDLKAFVADKPVA
jgi:malic enzyme